MSSNLIGSKYVFGIFKAFHVRILSMFSSYDLPATRGPVSSSITNLAAEFGGDTIRQQILV